MSDGSLTFALAVIIDGPHRFAISGDASVLKDWKYGMCDKSRGNTILWKLACESIRIDADAIKCGADPLPNVHASFVLPAVHYQSMSLPDVVNTFAEHESDIGERVGWVRNNLLCIGGGLGNEHCVPREALMNFVAWASAKENLMYHGSPESKQEAHA